MHTEHTSNLIHPILYIQTSHSNLTESFQSDKYKLPIQNTSNLIHTNFMHRTLPTLYIQTSHKEHFQLPHANFTYRTPPILYIQTSHVEHFQSYTYKLHIQNTSNLIHTNFYNLIYTNFTY